MFIMRTFVALGEDTMPSLSVEPETPEACRSSTMAELTFVAMGEDTMRS